MNKILKILFIVVLIWHKYNFVILIMSFLFLELINK